MTGKCERGDGKAPWPLQQWRHAVAGCSAGLATTLALHPLDVIKTRLQVQDGAQAGAAYQGTLDALRCMVRQEGWRALYAGLTPALVGSTLAWGAYFWTYNRAKDRYSRLLEARAGTAAEAGGGGSGARLQLGPAAHLAAAAEAGVIVCLLTNPIWVAKTRLQLQRRQVEAAAAAVAAGPAAAAAAAAVVGGLPRPPAAAASACSLQYKGFLDCLVQVRCTWRLPAPPRRQCWCRCRCPSRRLLRGRCLCPPDCALRGLARTVQGAGALAAACFARRHTVCGL